MAALDSSYCQQRSRRLLDVIASQRLDAILLTDCRDIYYVTGLLYPSEFPLALLLESGGNTSLIGPEKVLEPTTDRWVGYEWNIEGTKFPDLQAQLLGTLCREWKPVKLHNLGVQHQSLNFDLAEELRSDFGIKLVAIDHHLADMQSRKDPDEVQAIRDSIHANQGAYAAAARAIRPGATELEVLAAGIEGALLTAGTKLFHDGDYQSGQFNGPARNRAIEAGELYIIDAWTCIHGYWSDMSRTFVVGQQPSDEQTTLYEHIRELQRELPKLLKAGLDGTEIFEFLDTRIRQHPPLKEKGLTHHGGHAIGLRNHEMPDINRLRGGKLQIGNVICVEPGGYFAAARLGVRLENMYLITAGGCEDLCDDPGDLMVCGA